MSEAVILFLCVLDKILLKAAISLAMIKFKFQLNAQYFIPILLLLYMFRAPMRPSSGGPLYIYNIWFYVSLFW